MAQAARYLFDLDFAAPPEPEVDEQIEEIPPEPMITVAEHERLLAEAKELSFAQGEQTARDAREQLASEQTLELQQSILNDIGMIYTEVGHLMARLEKDASKLAFAFAARFAEKLVAQEPKAEIMALLNQILAPLRQTPHISIRLNEAIAEDITAEIDKQMNELGFEGKVTILPDPAVMAGDCEVEWADGGIGRNMRSAIRKAEKLLDDHFAHVPDPEDADEEETSEQEESQPPETGEPGLESENEPMSEMSVSEMNATPNTNPTDQPEPGASTATNVQTQSDETEVPSDKTAETALPPQSLETPADGDLS